MAQASSRSAQPSYALLEAALGTPLDPALLERALTHRSYAYEHGGLPTNERLEFLGDAVLGLVVAEALFEMRPELPESQLAPRRSAVVSTKALGSVARSLGLGAWLRLGKGEERTGGRDKTTILADTMEALIGAVYTEHGLPGASTLVRTLFGPLLEATGEDGAAMDWKTALQELGAATGLGVPQYVLSESGPDHAKSFVARVHLGGKQHGEGEGSTKKEAEQEAARLAVAALQPAPEPAPEPALEQG